MGAGNVKIFVLIKGLSGLDRYYYLEYMNSSFFKKNEFKLNL